MNSRLGGGSLDSAGVPVGESAGNIRVSVLDGGRRAGRATTANVSVPGCLWSEGLLEVQTDVVVKVSGA